MSQDFIYAANLLLVTQRLEKINSYKMLESWHTLHTVMAIVYHVHAIIFFKQEVPQLVQFIL